MNIPPPILEDFYNQGGDDDGDDHEHEDEQRPYTHWRLATNSDETCIAIGYRMRPIINNSSILFVLASHASRVVRVFLL